MESIVHDEIGFVHLIAATLALITGTIVIVKKKGTLAHKRTGYVYVFSMLVMNITAFGLYRLFGGFGMFHFFAIVSFITTLLGIYPVVFRKKVKHWYLMHMRLMSWSVVGLYAAFAAEIGTRLTPVKYFFFTVGVSSMLVILVGAYFIYKQQRVESKKLKQNS